MPVPCGRGWVLNNTLRCRAQHREKRQLERLAIENELPLFQLLPMVRRVPGYRQNVLGSEIGLSDGALTLYRNNNVL